MDNIKTKRNIQPFNGEKYSVWKFRIRALLTELEVIKVIDEEPIIRLETWEKQNRTAKSVIVEYLADSFLSFAKEELTAKEILKNLDALYERKSLATQLAIRKKLLGLKLQGDISLAKHFTVFDDLMAELMAAGAKLEETDKVSHLLLTLPTSYDGVITAIETLSEDNLTLSFVKTRLLDHEVKIKNEYNDTSTKILHVRANNSTAQSLNGKRFDSYKPYYNKNFKANKKSFIKCHHCGRKGHVKNDCYYFKRNQQQNFNGPNRPKQQKPADRKRTIQTVELTEQATFSSESSGFAFMSGNFESCKKGNQTTFLLDSGASDHIINREDLFSSYSSLNTPFKISIAKQGEYVTATKRGTLDVISNTGIHGTLEDVLFCPEVPYNLLSVSRMQRAGLTITFNQHETNISKDGKILMRGKTINNLISVDFEVKVNRSVSQFCNNDKNNYNLWHQRFGHISKHKFLELRNKCMTDDINLIESVLPDDRLCEACLNGKQTRLPFNVSKDKRYIKRPLFVVHTDVCGPITPSTIDNKNYFVLFVDQFTHYCVSYLITYKSEVFSAFKDYVAKSEAKFNSKLVNLYCDNGREYLSNEMKDYCVSKGISYHFTVPRTPQQNGVSERMVRTITEKARAMINGANLPNSFWGEAVLTAVYLINISPTRALQQSQTPFELWHDKKPKIKYLKVFGSTVFVHNKTSKTKFDPKSWKGILVGYVPNGYKVWNTECEKYELVRDVIVDEVSFLQSRPKLRFEGNEMDNFHDTKLTPMSGSQECDSAKSDMPKTDSIKSDNPKSD